MITEQFVTAGRAIFTVQNNRNDHYTYRVQRGHNSDSPLFVSMLSGPDQYTYIGILTRQGTCQITAKSSITANSTGYKVFNWAMAVIKQLTPLPDGYSIQHEGRCARCGRALTDPESIRTGFGPYCRTKS